MATKIEWATKVWNPITGCTKGCKYCYAEVFAKRLQKNPNPKVSEKYRNAFKPTFHQDSLAEPLFWNKCQRVFVGSMGDLFDPEFDFETFDTIMEVMRDQYKHTFMLLTKNPIEMQLYARQWCEKYGYPSLPWNVWCGVTVTNQEDADRRIPTLLAVPSYMRFVSIEPMVGPVHLNHMDVEKAGHKEWCFINALNGKHDDMGRPCKDVPKLDWVIVGGMTGPKSTPMHRGWVISLRDQCKQFGTPFFFKGWGDWGMSDEEERKLPSNRWKWVDFVNGDICDAVEPFPERNVTHHHSLMVKVGKKLAGRLLDGKEYSEIPNLIK